MLRMSRLFKNVRRAWNVLPSRSLRLAFHRRVRFRRRASCLFVSAFPKSGSTFLVTALAHASGYPHYFLGQDFRSEQDLYFPHLVDAWSMPVVSHQHTRATIPNLEFLRQFQIRPIILTRQLTDCLVSLRDHLCNESLVTPTFCAQEDFPHWSTMRQYDALIDLAAGWYLDFYSGWQRAQAEGMELLWLDYGTLIANTRECIERVIDFYGLSITDACLKAAVDLTRSRGDTTRKNVGVSGRGQRELTSAQLVRLDTLTGYFPDTDFSAIGAPFSSTIQPKQNKVKES